MATRPTRSARSTRSAWLAAQLALAAAVVALVGRVVVRQWGAVRESASALHPHWGWMVASAAVVLLTYALLIEAWRLVLAGWGAGLSFRNAARIWFVSSFGKYVPGKVWAISAMGLMSARAGVSPLAAAGSSVIVQLLNIAAGLAVLVATGSEALRGEYAWARPVAVTVVALSLVALVVVPPLLPRLLAWVSRRTGREIPTRALPARVLWAAAAVNVVAWVLYGIAFRLFTRATLGEATGATAGYVAVYTASYLLGYLAVFAPGGVGVREVALLTLMPRLGLASAADAVLLAALSRLWLTVLEIVPGLLFLARAGVRTRPTQTADDGSS